MNTQSIAQQELSHKKQIINLTPSIPYHRGYWDVSVQVGGETQRIKEIGKTTKATAMKEGRLFAKDIRKEQERRLTESVEIAQAIHPHYSGRDDSTYKRVAVDSQNNYGYESNRRQAQLERINEWEHDEGPDQCGWEMGEEQQYEEWGAM